MTSYLFHLGHQLGQRALRLSLGPTEVAGNVADLPVFAAASAEAEVAQLTAALQRYRARAGERARRWLEEHRSAGRLASGLDAYRDQLDGLARPMRTPTATNPGAAAASLRADHRR